MLSHSCRNLLTHPSIIVMFSSELTPNSTVAHSHQGNQKFKTTTNTCDLGSSIGGVVLNFFCDEIS